MYYFYRNSNWGHWICPLYRGCPPLGESIIRGFSVCHTKCNLILWISAHKDIGCIYLPSISTDIRDTVNYKEVMKQYKLGPNGGIVTALNLFATRFDQVMGFIERRAPQCK